MSLDYFALDVDIASDERIQELISRQGGLSLSVYILLLTQIYSSPDGCSLRVTDRHIMAIATSLRCKVVFVHEVIAAARRVGLFSQDPDPMLLTSPAIRRRYEAISSRTPEEQQPDEDAPAQPPDPPPDAPIQFPPTSADVLRYLRQMGYDMIVDASEFVRYYSAIGWSIDGVPIADWRQKCDKWAYRRMHPDTRKQRKPKARESAPQEPERQQQKPAVSAEQFLHSRGLSSITDILKQGNNANNMDKRGP